MTIFEDPLYQKYIALIKVEDEMRNAYIRWMNTQIPLFDLGDTIGDLVEVKQVTYVQDRFGTEVAGDNLPLNPNAILNIIIKTSFGFSDTVRRVSFDKFGPISTKLNEELKHFISLRKEHYQVCDKISKKYKDQLVTNGDHRYRVTKIDYYAMPIFYSRPNLLDERINPKEYRLRCNTN